MSKEEFLKIQTCVLKVNIHCEGCKNKVKKILQRIEGVYTINIDSEWGKVTVSGNVDSATLIKKLMKKGKHAELWGSQKGNNNNQNQLKNLQIDSGKGGNVNKGKGGEKGTNNPNQMQQMKGGNPGMVLPQQLQQMKGIQDMKILPPQLKDLKIPVNLGGGNPKTVKFDLPEEDGFTDDEFDDEDEYDDEEDDDDYDDDDDFDDEMDIMPPNKMKPPVMGNGGGGAQMPNIMHLMNGKKGGIMPQMNIGGGNKGGGNQIQGGGSPKKSGKNGGGHPQDGKSFGGNGGQNKNSGGGGGHGGGPNFNGNGGNKGGGIMNNGLLPSMPNMMAMKANVPNMGPMPTGQMGHHMGQMGNLPMGQIPAVQGLPAPGMSSARSNGGYFQAPGPEILAGNPYQQQQMAAMMMNQQHANGNERFQPMMYAPQPPAVNYLPPPYPYYPYHQPSDNYGSMFSDENPSACKVM